MSSLFRRAAMVCSVLIASFQLCGCEPSLDLVDFVDNTESYKGQTIEMNLVVWESMRDGESIRDFTGRSVEFKSMVPGSISFDVMIDIPSGLSVPKADGADDVIVTFVSTQGSLNYGNEAVSITRP